MKKFPLKSFNVDFNWYEGKAAPPDLFVECDPKKLVEWYKGMHVNNFWTFGTTYNGYAWYDSRLAPKAVGLRRDFLAETVELGHQAGMEVFAYTCLGDNGMLISRKPEIARVDETMYRLPLTEWYLDYFCGICAEIVRHAPVDGIVIDWFRYPQNRRSRWIPEERELFRQQMGEAISEDAELPRDVLEEYERRCLEHAWRRISQVLHGEYHVKIWTNQPFEKADDPIWNGNILLKEADYVLNECPDFSLLSWIASQAGEDTMVVQNLCGWAGHRLDELQSIDLNRYGLFGFAAADAETCLPEERTSAVNYKNIEIIREFYNKT